MRISLTDPRLSHGERLRDIAEKLKQPPIPQTEGKRHAEVG